MAGIGGGTLCVFNFLGVHLKNPDALVSPMANQPRGFRQGRRQEGFNCCLLVSSIKDPRGVVDRGPQAFQH